MAVKSPQEGTKQIDIRNVNTDDLVYSLEVKLIQRNKEWFLMENLIPPAMEQHDPTAELDVQILVETIKARIAGMTPEELENLKNTLRSPVLKAIKDLDTDRQLDLGSTYQSLEPGALQKKKEEVEYVIRIGQGVDEILKMIEEAKKTKTIQTASREAVKKIKPSQE